MKRVFILVLAFVLTLSLAACGNNGNTSTNSTSVSTVSSNNTITMNLTQIQVGNYSSLQGSWTEVAYQVNKYDGNGYQWYAGALTPDADSLSVSSGKIVFNGSEAVIQGNKLIDSAGSHSLSFEKNGSSLLASLADQTVAINWSVSFYPKGVTNDLQPNNGVKIDNTKNLIAIWSSNDNYVAVFAQTDTNS